VKSFLINRARRHWQVLSTLVLGVLISTAFLASGPLIVNTVMDFALPQKIHSSLEETGTIFLSTYNDVAADKYRLINAEITDTLPSNFPEIYEIVRSISSPWIFPWQADSLLNDEWLKSKSLGGIEKRIELVSGNWPEKPAPGSNIFQRRTTTSCHFPCFG
jgi:hypothetical protein